ncbi:signal transduction response regulator [Clostridioides difficile]|uniref:Stage 0 sporulation protein A homolog n=4 Tax=Clostridioides difficile TaxID=1496 RepID=A0AAX3H114_CLODI|nr:response regulator transcription factor [Clostridioides difficile]OFT99876.1 DNA-binding response regulator [Clostridium sp. HMSC19E03]OFU12911.1 DNA-binding response regulator [Clostridium sp. HMSC19C09]OFU21671.1 DNA-binding response regulator [Clostridium sp. HMSC19C05]OFU22032.1 DNA-binding response regulator [Clostridium sp. HMSC19C08]OFU28987.1 DNA-binding response regulator [Clostridium sp. HMSC19B11]OFU34802.1 DNA-binding response regulator [Clostridium sp. HMSC19B10]OFU39293.1 DN
MSSILLVEDDLSLIYGLEFSIQKSGFSIDIARTVKEAMQMYEEKNYDLLLLDVSLPDGNGFQICEKVREVSNIPIIFLTASDEEVNVVMGLDMGGDDYITKPFKLNELISRIKALLRRYNVASNVNELSSNNITIKLLENRVFKGEFEVELTTAEYKLLCLFMKNKNIVLTRKNILDKLWDGNGSFIDDNTLSVYVRRLRNKIEDNPENPKFLLTVRRMGYKWNVIK